MHFYILFQIFKCCLGQASPCSKVFVRYVYIEFVIRRFLSMKRYMMVFDVDVYRYFMRRYAQVMKAKMTA